jgi:hypothetical protein
MLDHDVVFRLPAARLPLNFGLGMGAEVHMRSVEPYEERHVRLDLALEEILGSQSRAARALVAAMVLYNFGVALILAAAASGHTWSASPCGRPLYCTR